MHWESANWSSTSRVKHDSSRPLADFCKIAWRVSHSFLFGRFLFNAIVNTVRLKLLDYPDHIFSKGALNSIEDISFPYSCSESKNRKWRIQGKPRENLLIKKIHRFWNRSKYLIKLNWKCHKSLPSLMVFVHTVISWLFLDELFANLTMELNCFL